MADRFARSNFGLFLILSKTTRFWYANAELKAVMLMNVSHSVSKQNKTVKTKTFLAVKAK